jgi:phage/plasmid-like protein (TIGR03299 family)
MHEVETMFSAREVPWHGLGTITLDVLTATDAIVAAGLDWDVVKEPAFGRRLVHNEDGMGYLTYPVPNRFNLVRDTDKRFMSTVSDIYKPFQNRDAFSFMDNLVDSGEAKYETAGSLRNGNVIFITMHVPHEIQVGGQDRHEMYILLRNTHDGSGRISVYVVMVRVVCMNTLTFAINGAQHTWGVTHTSDVKGKITEARETLGLSFKYADKFKIEAEKLMAVTVTDDQIIALLESTMPDRSTREKEIEAIIANHAESDTIDGYRNTGWGVLNAVSEFQEHVKENRSEEALFTRLLAGPDAKLRNNLRTKILTFA